MSNNQARSRTPLIVGIVVALAAIGIGGFLWLTQDDAPEKLSLSDDPTTTEAPGDTSSGSSSTSAPGGTVSGDSLDGKWTVVAGTGDEATIAGYRVEEVFAAGARRSEAAGRTADVTGSVTVEGGKVTAAAFEVNTTTLKSNEGRRDNRIRTDGLETDKFTTATFTLTDPIALPDLPDGKVVTVSATGDLTLHGETQSVKVDLQVKASGDRFVVAGNAPVVMADYGIHPPSIGGFVEVDDHGSFEFIINLSRG